MTAFLRIFFVGGLIAYRGLFNWIRPTMYIPTMLIGPVFQILFFAYLGRYSGLKNDAFFVVGNAVQASAMSAVFAGTMTIANERNYQTLSPLLATPANRRSAWPCACWRSCSRRARTGYSVSSCIAGRSARSCSASGVGQRWLLTITGG